MANNASAAPIRVFLVGIGDGLARSLARYLQGDPRAVLIGAAPDVALARLLLPMTTPDLALLDWVSLRANGAPVVESLRSTCPGIRFACVAPCDGPYRADARSAGAEFFLVADRLHEQLPPILAQLHRP